MTWECDTMGKRYPYVLNLRLSEEQWLFLETVQLETKTDKSESVRTAIDILQSVVSMGVTCRLVKCPHAGEVIVRKPI